MSTVSTFTMKTSPGSVYPRTPMSFRVPTQILVYLDYHFREG